MKALQTKLLGAIVQVKEISEVPNWGKGMAEEPTEQLWRVNTVFVDDSGSLCVAIHETDQFGHMTKGDLVVAYATQCVLVSDVNRRAA